MQDLISQATGFFFSNVNTGFYLTLLCVFALFMFAMMYDAFTSLTNKAARRKCRGKFWRNKTFRFSMYGAIFCIIIGGVGFAVNIVENHGWAAIDFIEKNLAKGMAAGAIIAAFGSILKKINGVSDEEYYREKAIEEIGKSSTRVMPVYTVEEVIAVIEKYKKTGSICSDLGIIAKLPEHGCGKNNAAIVTRIVKDYDEKGIIPNGGDLWHLDQGAELWKMPKDTPVTEVKNDSSSKSYAQKVRDAANAIDTANEILQNNEHGFPVCVEGLTKEHRERFEELYNNLHDEKQQELLDKAMPLRVPIKDTNRSPLAEPRDLAAELEVQQEIMELHASRKLEDISELGLNDEPSAETGYVKGYFDKLHTVLDNKYKDEPSYNILKHWLDESSVFWFAWYDETSAEKRESILVDPKMANALSLCTDHRIAIQMLEAYDKNLRLLKNDRNDSAMLTPLQGTLTKANIEDWGVALFETSDEQYVGASMKGEAFVSLSSRGDKGCIRVTLNDYQELATELVENTGMYKVMVHCFGVNTGLQANKYFFGPYKSSDQKQFEKLPYINIIDFPDTLKEANAIVNRTKETTIAQALAIAAIKPKILEGTALEKLAWDALSEEVTATVVGEENADKVVWLTKANKEKASGKYIGTYELSDSIYFSFLSSGTRLKIRWRINIEEKGYECSAFVKIVEHRTIGTRINPAVDDCGPAVGDPGSTGPQGENGEMAACLMGPKASPDDNSASQLMIALNSMSGIAGEDNPVFVYGHDNEKEPTKADFDSDEFISRTYKTALEAKEAFIDACGGDSELTSEDVNRLMSFDSIFAKKEKNEYIDKNCWVGKDGPGKNLDARDVEELKQIDAKYDISYTGDVNERKIGETTINLEGMNYTVNFTDKEAHKKNEETLNKILKGVERLEELSEKSTEKLKNIKKVVNAVDQNVLSNSSDIVKVNSGIVSMNSDVINMNSDVVALQSSMNEKLSSNREAVEEKIREIAGISSSIQNSVFSTESMVKEQEEKLNRADQALSCIDGNVLSNTNKLIDLEYKISSFGAPNPDTESSPNSYSQNVLDRLAKFNIVDMTNDAKFACGMNLGFTEHNMKDFVLSLLSILDLDGWSTYVSPKNCRIDESHFSGGTLLDIRLCGKIFSINGCMNHTYSLGTGPARIEIHCDSGYSRIEVHIDGCLYQINLEN